MTEQRPIISYRALAIVAGCAFGYIGTYVMLWIATQDAQQAAVIQLMITGAILILTVGTGMVGAGALIVVRIMRHYEDRQYDPRHVIDVQPALPRLDQATRFVRDGDNTWINGDVILADAARIMQLRAAGFPAPRRAVIEKQLGTTDHARIKRALDYLAEIGEVTPALDGGKREWTGRG